MKWIYYSHSNASGELWEADAQGNNANCTQDWLTRAECDALIADDPSIEFRF
jgi:hypothetical protein